MTNFDNEIVRNSEKINLLKSRIDESFKVKNKSDDKLKEWQQACSEFHAQFDSLAFPGGLEGAYQKVLDGDPDAMEAAVSFLEVRPYFFRSGYIFKDLIRKVKKAPLSSTQQERFKVVYDAYIEYRKSRNA